MVLYVSFLLFFVCPAFGQKIVTTRGSAQLELTKDKSRLAIEKEARKLATIDALERAFGRVVVQGNSTYLYNMNSGESTQTLSVFNMIANTAVKGEVIEVISENFTDLPGVRTVNGKKEKITDVRCDIRVKAREIVTPPVEFEASPLVCPAINCKSTRFNNNADFYFYFRSSQKGYLSIFLDDGTDAYCLFPCKSMDVNYETGVPVKGDIDYILFDPESADQYFKNGKKITDEIQVYAKREQEMNRIFVIFSINPLNKPRLDRNDPAAKLSEKDLEAGFILPQSLPSEAFQKWMNKNRGFSASGMQVAAIDITITKVY